MALLITVALIMSALLLINTKLLSSIMEKQHDHVFDMIDQVSLYDKKLITTNRDEKLEMMITVMQMTTPDLIWTLDVTTLEFFAKTFIQDPDVSSVTFFGEDGKYLAGSKKTKGTKFISRDIVREGEKLGTMVTGVTSDLFEQRLDELDERITLFKQSAIEDSLRLDKYQVKLIYIIIGVFLFILLVTVLMVRNIVEPIGRLSQWSRKVAAGDFNIFDIDAPKNEIGELNANFKRMVEILRKTAAENEKNIWLAKGHTGLDARMRGDFTITELANRIISYIAKYVEAPVGALFINNREDLFVLAADFAGNFVDNTKVRFKVGEGLLGQVAQDRQPVCLSDVPDDFITVSSGLGQAKPRYIHVVPCIYNNEVKAVLELATFIALSEGQASFLEQAAASIAITVKMAQARDLLEESF